MQPVGSVPVRYSVNSRAGCTSIRPRLQPSPEDVSCPTKNGCVRNYKILAGLLSSLASIWLAGRRKNLSTSESGQSKSRADARAHPQPKQRNGRSDGTVDEGIIPCGSSPPGQAPNWNAARLPNHSPKFRSR